ncbi:zinc finger and SCAN domain-containing protein 2 [Cottoperca gobio]|uniref:Zinc finger and SCAN domain-containing protein 2-like n=1 Tax=Cottoperca gobio TaxID=56716 RepID=A0A6J2R903_COTGO|nr:zinc finger and SCAN domain-containing protein 2-like [Cottoperca gobio]XP_029307271.1 zinc finger and SCAN domain-containing protein 2-like [Cottoperca gobio]XP_029307272.1 zinc finger and SCAN domain-containing protein 2-like [Cottoperca gobio]XP_029307273.1 zinc finger and SCAN domain-containing protein 2-like [Cottoperca gobio]XP_029307274.1 zinc finger and SCAN domain-containing protein 2-like [Cottoperca gobio]XP_029307275.1 zinc finger and SCAN domain-containing protein 2-like [Cotto
MSIEYTIDIQLAELGYPDILQPGETSVGETPSHSPTSLSTTHVQRLVVRGQQSADGKEAGPAKQTSNNEQSTAVSTSPLSVTCTPRNPADLPQLIPEQDDKREKDVGGRGTTQDDSTEMQQDVANDSDDSEVYEEEELDEDDDDDDDDEEEGLHNESSHSGEYRCSVCDLQLPSKFKLQDHMNLHTGARPYCCAECGKRFCQIYSYRVHLRTHAQTKVDLLRCRVCLRGFASQEDLKLHLAKTHFEKKFYECDLCKRVFTSLKECESHVQLHKCKQDVVCAVCGRNFSSPKSLARHRRTTCHHNFKCTDCTKTFTKKNALLKHSFSHLGLLPYTCIRCRCHFRLAKLYRQHKCEPERIHCVACLREFLSQEDFQQHKKDTGCWGNQEPKGDEIRCLECGQRFDTSEELKKHAGAHQRVLKCAECGKGFRSALLLMSHMGGHAGKSPCLCQSCGLGFPHQQNYDSHLKTCGQTPQPASALKKRPASKSSSKKVGADTASLPAEPVKDSRSPGLVTGGVSAGYGPSDGLWKLTLNKRPPPGVKLVVFLPVCATQTNDLTLPPATSLTQPVPAMQGQTQDALPPLSNECLGGNVALGAPLNGPLNLVTGIKQDPELQAPLDLSKKCNSYKSALSNSSLLPIKSEPGEFKISGEANGTEKQECKNSYSKAIVKTNEVKPFKMDPMDFSSFKVNTTSSGLMIDFRKEPQSPAPDFDLWSSRSCQLTEKEMKIEVDISQPADVKKLTLQ